MEKNQVIFAILFTTAVLLLLAFVLLFFFARYRARSNQYIRERENLKKEFEQTLLQSQIEIQESTLTAVGRDLHDNIGQLLVSSKALIGVSQRDLENIPETLTVAEQTISQAINEVRSLSKMLDKEWLQQFDFMQNLQAEVNRINSLKTLEINFSGTEKLLWEPEEQIILFRVVQEAIQNSLKHAQANTMDITLNHTVSSLVLKISDDGKGFKEDDIKAGLGLKNMKKRIQLLGGTIEWISSNTAGSEVKIKLPVKKIEA